VNDEPLIFIPFIGAVVFECVQRSCGQTAGRAKPLLPRSKVSIRENLADLQYALSPQEHGRSRSQENEGGPF